MNFQTLLSEVQAHLYKPRTTEELKTIARKSVYYQETKTPEEVLGDVLSFMSSKDMVNTDRVFNKTYWSLKIC